MSYLEAVQYLESFIDYEKFPSYPYKESLRLERVRGFLAAIGNPQDSLKCIHIAGSKGKGSTCAFVAYILREAGYRAGLYTSPHLSDFRERIRILSSRFTVHSSQLGDDFEGMIAEDELSDLVTRLKPDIEKYNRGSEYGPLSFFEIYTALAFTYFKKQKVDFAVLETGLGGRLDATNTVNPLVCVITPISYEHTDKLGHTLREIAAEKAGIIKRQKIKAKSQKKKKEKRQKLLVVCAPQEKEAIEVIRAQSKEAGAKLYELNKDIFYEAAHQGFNVVSLFGEYPNLKIRLLGNHQFINAAAAIGAVEALRYHGIMVNMDSIREGLYNALWPGRCEVLSRNPIVVLDGAQNAASAGVLKQAVKENFQYKRLVLVLGVSQDKDRKGICGQLYDLADEVILTKANNPRATDPKALAGYFAGKAVRITKNVQEAKKASGNRAGGNDLILVTGSLFVVGEFRKNDL